MKKILITTIAIIALASASAQTNNDALIFEAMQMEMERSMNELRIDNMPAPFFIQYIISEGEMIDIRASLGSIISTNHRPKVRSVFARVMTESNELTNDGQFTNQGGFSMALTIDNDLDQLRRGIWRVSDANFKFGLEMLTEKRNELRRTTLSEAEAALLDFHSAEPVEVFVPTHFTHAINRAELEALSERLSRVFFEFPNLYATNVTFSAAQSVFYTMTSEGTRTRQPLSQVMIRASALVRATDGAVLNDNIQIIAADLSTLPSEEELMSTIRAFAANLQALGNAPLVTDFYNGPVLFEGEPAVSIFLRSLLSTQGIQARRRPVVAQQQQTARNLPIGRRLLDARFTVINHTQKTEFNGIPLVGSYHVDAEGIIPEPSLVMIDRGILTNFLNNRIPTEFAARSNGNQRIGSNPEQIVTEMRPSVLEIQATDGVSRQTLRQQLLDSARDEGLPYAYIVRQTTGAARIYQVDVETGVETLMRSPNIEQLGIRQLRRVDGVSSEIIVSHRLLNNFSDTWSNVSAFPISIISPCALLFQDVEINIGTVTLETKPTVANPLLRD